MQTINNLTKQNQSKQPHINQNKIHISQKEQQGFRFTKIGWQKVDRSSSLISSLALLSCAASEAAVAAEVAALEARIAHRSKVLIWRDRCCADRSGEWTITRDRNTVNRWEDERRRLDRVTASREEQGSAAPAPTQAMDGAERRAAAAMGSRRETMKRDWFLVAVISGGFGGGPNRGVFWRVRWWHVLLWD